ncbi:MAG: sporulation protein YunB [Anaerotignum sp.]|nr:sporulation protein YunB [Anaerotignum sp.]
MKKKSNKVKMRFIFIFFSIVFFIFSFSFLDMILIPPLKEISHIQCKSLANKVIDSSAAELLNEFDLTENNLVYNQSEGYSANVVLINQLCTSFSSKITEKLSRISDKKISIPLGTITDWSFFANKGPSIPFTLLPMGSAKVDYLSTFQSVGINQINYKIWLNIFIELKIVNPLYHETITMERKIMLADIVFSGKVPDHYLQIGNQGEYLLTE